MKLLIDECLSLELAKAAVAAGHQGSTHVTWIGLGGAKDWTVARRAVDEDFVLVTNNTPDLVALYAREDLHVGLVCLNAAHGTMSLDLQRRLFRLALDELAEDEAYNEVVEITADARGGVRIERYDLPC